jgi:hypothetical protein
VNTYDADQRIEAAEQGEELTPLSRAIRARRDEACRREQVEQGAAPLFATDEDYRADRD